MSRRKMVAVASKRFGNEAQQHLDNLHKAHEATTIGHANCGQLCQQALKAFRFFDFELVQEVGLEKAKIIVSNLSNISPRKSIIDYYNSHDNFQQILLDSSKVTNQNAEFPGKSAGYNEIKNEVEIKFKFSEGLESLDLTLNLFNAKNRVRPWIPLLIQSKCTLIEKTKKFSWVEKHEVKKFLSVTNLGAYETQPIQLKNALNVSNLGLSDKIKVLFSEVKVMISIPEVFSIHPINNKQISRRFQNVGQKFAFPAAS